MGCEDARTSQSGENDEVSKDGNDGSYTVYLAIRRCLCDAERLIEIIKDHDEGIIKATCATCSRADTISPRPLQVVTKGHIFRILNMQLLFHVVSSTFPLLMVYDKIERNY